MKKYTAIALLLAAAITLSACKEEDNFQVENNGGTTSSTTTGNTPEESSDNNTDKEENSGENTSEETEESTGEPDGENGGESSDDPDGELIIELPSFEETLAGFDSDSFTAPDGKEIPLTEATSNMWDSLVFDFAYMRYSNPIYSDTVSNPGLYDFENFEFTVDPYAEVEATPFMVKKGDVLDNGLTVAEASYMIAPYGVRMNEVELEGEITLEGLLFCYFEEEYGFDQDELIFYPDPTSGTVPMIYSSLMITSSGVDLYSEFAFVCDSRFFSLGHINDIGSADWFAEGSFVRAKVTMENLRLNDNDNFGTRCHATAKNVELVG